MNFGPMELGIILVLFVLLFGARRLPELARSVGQAMREFKDSVSAASAEEKQAVEEKKSEQP